MSTDRKTVENIVLDIQNDSKEYYYSPHILLYKDISYGQTRLEEYANIVIPIIEKYVESLRGSAIDYDNDETCGLCKVFPDYKNLGIEDVVLVCECGEESMMRFAAYLAIELGCKCRFIMSKALDRYTISNNSSFHHCDDVNDQKNIELEEYSQYKSISKSRYALCSKVYDTAKYKYGIVFYSRDCAFNKASEDVITICTRKGKLGNTIPLTIYDYKNKCYIDQEEFNTTKNKRDKTINDITSWYNEYIQNK